MYWTGVSGVGSMGAVGTNATIHLSEAPREAPLYMSHTIHCTQIQSVLHWEGFKDSSISPDNDHERFGMMGGGGGGGSNLMSPSMVLFLIGSGYKVILQCAYNYYMLVVLMYVYV